MSARSEQGVGFARVVRDHSSADFFDAAANEVLLLRRCDRCRLVLAPETRICACGNPKLEPYSACGRGNLVSWAVVHREFHPTLRSETPYLTGLIELDEGPWLHARVVDVDADSVHAGMALGVRFVRSAPTGDGELGEVVPVFAPC